MESLDRTVRKWQSSERHYEINPQNSTFTKTEIPEWKNSRGQIIKPFESRHRLINEYLTLQYVSTTTNIPVPKPLKLEFVDDCLSLTTELIDGLSFNSLQPEIQSRSKQKVIDNIEQQVIPQLQKLKSDQSGSLHGVIIPPRRVFDKYSDQNWVPKFSEQKYNFCHNDLGQHNILCDANSGDVKAIIDWECAGYYLPQFEASLWMQSNFEQEDDPAEISNLEYLLGTTVFNVSPEDSTLLRET